MTIDIMFTTSYYDVRPTCLASEVVFYLGNRPNRPNSTLKGSVRIMAASQGIFKGRKSKRLEIVDVIPTGEDVADNIPFVASVSPLVPVVIVPIVEPVPEKPAPKRRERSVPVAPEPVSVPFVRRRG